MNYSIRRANSDDLQQIKALLPRLANFEVPANRLPEQLWQGDLELILAWANNERPDVTVMVAVDDDTVLGLAAVSERRELLSREPSVHLEVLSLDECAEGHGIGSALMREVEQIALDKGARCISLHVFSANQRARALYERHGYAAEIIRYFKRIE